MYQKLTDVLLLLWSDLLWSRASLTESVVCTKTGLCEKISRFQTPPQKNIIMLMMNNLLPSSWIVMISWELRESIHSTVTLHALLFGICYAKRYHTLLSLFRVRRGHKRHLFTRLVKKPQAWVQPAPLQLPFWKPLVARSEM